MTSGLFIIYILGGVSLLNENHQHNKNSFCKNIIAHLNYDTTLGMDRLIWNITIQEW